MFRQKLTPQQAFQKMLQYCGYQERSHFEAREKLYGFGLNKSDVEELLSRLIEEDYLNEERYAILFVGGKFRMKKWGRIKIIHELKQKRVGSNNIKKAIKEIDEDIYNKTLYQLALAKWKSLKAEQYLNRLAKTTNFLLQKGYEQELISVSIKQIREK